MNRVFHIVVRGVDKRKILLDEQDRFRFIHDLFELNNQEVVSNNTISFKRKTLQDQYKTFRKSNVNPKERQPRKLLVKILCFILMPNHYHLLINENIERGMSRFMQKLNSGYAQYFNKKYEREGTLFQGRYKKVPIISEAHFIHLPFYIHFNCLDLKYPEWRERKLKNHKGVIKYLDSYRWSSHLDYCGIKNFPSVTQREFLNEFFGGPKEYRKAIGDWLKNLELESIEKVVLE